MASVAQLAIDARFGPRAIIAMAREDGAFFRTDEEGSGICFWKSHACWSQIFSFGRRRSGEFEIFLREGEHVSGPAADDAVGGAGDDVVRVLGADEGDGVDGMGVAAGGGAREWGFLAGVRGAGAGVPE